MSQRRHPPNRLLAWERLERGWSYEEITERVRAHMADHGESDTGLCANTVRRWETGERRPEPRYRKHLVAILGKTASELGLLTPDELAIRPQPSVTDEIRRLPYMTSHESGENGVDRTVVLRALLGVGALPLLAPLLSFDPQETAAVNTRPATDPDSYATIARCHQRMYWTSPAVSLYEAAYAHTHLGVTLTRATDSGSRVPLATALAQSALLTARLAFFDLNQPAIAQRCYDVALAATREAGDHALAAAVLGHLAFIPAFSHRADDARSLITAALQHTWHGVPAIVRSWLHCVASEIEGRAGAGKAGLHHIDLATAAIDTGTPPPQWLDFYDTSRLHCFAGYAALAAGDHAGAAHHLTNALHHLDSGAGKQRSVVLADLATAHSHDSDHAADYLHQAIDTLHTDWYAAGLDRVRAARALLADSSPTSALDERITTLATSRAVLPA